MFSESENYTREPFELAQEYMKAYKMYSEVEDDWPYPHNIITPDTFSFVEDATAKLVQSFTNVDPIVAIRCGVNSNTQSEKVSQQLEIVLQHIIGIEEGDFHYQWENYCRTGAQLGNGYMMVTPIFKEGLFDGKLDYVKFSSKDFWDVLPDPRAERILDSTYLIVRQVTNMQKLRALADNGWPLENLDKLESAVSGGVSTDWHKQLLVEIGMDTFEIRDNDIELLYFFNDGNLRILAQRCFYIYDSSDMAESPFVYGIPVVDYKFTPQPNEFFAIGIPQMIKDLQYNRNILRSQRLTNIDMVLSPPLKVRLGSEVDPSQLWMYPGAKMPVTEMDDVAWETFPDVTSGSYREDDQIQMSMEDATSLHRAARGQTESKRQSGTEIIRLQQAALSRYDINIKRGEMALRQIAKRVVVYIHQFMDKQEYENIVGEPDAGFFATPLNNILRNFRFMPVGSSVSSIKEIRAQRSAQAFQLLSSIPPEVMQNNMGGAKPFIVDYYELMKNILDSAELPNKDRVLVLLQSGQQEEGGEQQQPEPQVMDSALELIKNGG